MSAEVTQVSDAVVSRLNASGLTTTAQRVHWFRQQLVELETRKVLVFPTKTATIPSTRGSDIKSHSLSVLVMEKCVDQTLTEAWVEDLEEFTEEIADHLNDPDSSLILDRFYVESVDIQAPDVELLTQEKTFFSQVDVVYREVG